MLRAKYPREISIKGGFSIKDFSRLPPYESGYRYFDRIYTWRENGVDFRSYRTFVSVYTTGNDRTRRLIGKSTAAIPAKDRRRASTSGLPEQNRTRTGAICFVGWKCKVHKSGSNSVELSSAYV